MFTFHWIDVCIGFASAVVLQFLVYMLAFRGRCGSDGHRAQKCHDEENDDENCLEVYGITVPKYWWSMSKAHKLHCSRTCSRIPESDCGCAPCCASDSCGCCCTCSCHAAEGRLPRCGATLCGTLGPKWLRTTYCTLHDPASVGRLTHMVILLS